MLIIVIVLIVFNIYTLSLLDFSEEDPIIIEDEEEEKVTSKIKVDVKGEVNARGVYELDEGLRVSDLIDRAGGLTENADTSIINLSKKLVDEMVIFIYSKEEVDALKADKEVFECDCPEVNDACITTEVLEPLIESEMSKDVEDLNDKVSLNSASLEELQELSGIGESKAQAIIDYRTENGPFTTIDEILNVKGIGESVFEKIKDNITP